MLHFLLSSHVAGSLSTEYVADNPSPIFAGHSNLHLYLEKRRLQARSFLRSQEGIAIARQLADEEIQRIKGKRPSGPEPNEGEEDRAESTQPKPELDDAEESEEKKPELMSDVPRSAYRPEGQGPRVMIVGGEAAGKTSLAKFLANYALRSPTVCTATSKGSQSAAAKDTDEKMTGWWPILVNLDPSEGAPPIPATLSAIPLSPVPLNLLPSSSPALPFGTFPQTTGYIPPGAAAAQAVSPLTLWLGRTALRDNEQHAKRLVEWLAEGIERRLARDLRARMSGLIIDTPGIVTADGRTKYALLQHCIRTLKGALLSSRCSQFLADSTRACCPR